LSHRQGSAKQAADQVRIAAADPAGRDAKWCFEQFFSELDARFETGYNPRAARPVDAREMRPPAGLLLLAYLRGKPVGCGALKLHESGVGEIKRLWVAPRVRGRGVGGRILSALERSAKARGAGVVHLDTNKALTEAIALYRSRGYVEVAPFNDEVYAHHWFEKRL
jgi:ribosomal protein S18 acetylase RimI-like enzyme